MVSKYTIIIVSIACIFSIHNAESRYISPPRSVSAEVESLGEQIQDTMKYLEELEQFYSQMDRPRERRVGQNMASALKKLSQIKDFYNEAGRPRFGKRFGRRAEESAF